MRRDRRRDRPASPAPRHRAASRRGSAPAASRPASRNSAPAAAPRPPSARAASSALRARFTSALSQASESRASSSFTAMSITRPASFAARSICLVRSRQRSASGCSASARRIQPGIVARRARPRPSPAPPPPCRRPRYPPSSVACALVSSSHGSASGSSSRFTLAKGSIRSTSLPSASSKAVERLLRRLARPRPPAPDRFRPASGSAPAARDRARRWRRCSSAAPG